MSDIPELTEFEVSWVAYYDVTEHTNDISEIKPEEISKNVSEIVEINPYDNGKVLYYDGPTRENYIIRVSTDGWITAHMDLKKEYGKIDDYEIKNNATEAHDGIHDIVNWVEANTANDIKNNVLERAIKNCLKGLEEWDDKISNFYEPKDVGLYHEEYDSNVNISVFSDSNFGTNTFSFTDETIIHKLIITSNGIIGSNNSSEISFDIDNTNLYDYRGSPDAFIAIDYTDEYNSGNKIKLESDTYLDGDVSTHVIALWN